MNQKQRPKTGISSELKMTIVIGFLLFVGIGLGTLGLFNPDFLSPQKMFPQEKATQRQRPLGESDNGQPAIPKFKGKVSQPKTASNI